MVLFNNYLKGGNVRNLEFIGYPMYSINEHGGLYSHYQNKFLKPYIKAVGGYHVYDLRNGAGIKKFYAHRLVGFAFLNHKGEQDINHKDGNTGNNHYTNLEWCNRSHNIKHSYDKLGRVHARGMLGRTGKLNKLTRPIYIPSKKTTVYGAPEAACLLGCSVSHIDKILLGGNVAFGANSCTYDLTI